MNKTLIAIIFSLLGIGTAVSQVSLTNAAPTATIDFSASMQPGVGFGAYTGAGFSPTAITGRLNSNAWEVKGWENGDLLFGAAMSNPAHGRGSVTTGVLTEGLYAYVDNPHSVANPALMIQASENNFTPGSITLRIQNQGTQPMTQLQVSYDLFIRNEGTASSSFNFSHSNDNIAFVEEPSLDYVSPEEPDFFQWTPVDVSPARSIIITGINVAPNGYYYIRWSGALVSGSGEQDEFGLDNISLTAMYGPPAPEINVVGNGLTILHNDMTPRAADGTEFANTFTGGSQSFKTFTIQNLGGAPLVLGAITITGANAADFAVTAPVPTGSIPGVAGSTVSVKDFNIRFTPSAPGVRTALINIASNDSNESPYVFMVRGLGVIPQPDITVTGATVNVGQVNAGLTWPPVTTNNTLFDTQVVGGTGQLKDFKIKNDGTAALLVLTGSPYVTIGGANPADFTVETQPNSGSVAPGFTKTFTIRFNPTAPGIRTAVVTIPNNDVIPDVFGNSEGPFTFLVQGTAVAPEIDVQGNGQPIVDGSTTPTLSNHTQFDNQNVATGFQDRTYTIRNTGNYQLTLGTVTLTGSPDFTIVTQPAATVAAGASTTLVVRFNPSASGPAQAVVNIPNNDYNENPYDFVIRGYGLDYVPCTYGAVETIVTQDFEATPATPTWTYTVTPTGSATVGAGTAYAVLSDGGMTERFLGGRSLQVSGVTSTIQMTPVNTSQFSDIELVLKLSSMSTTLSDGNDFADKVSIMVSTNGTTWSSELQVTGNTDAKWSFASGTGIATAVYDGNGVNTVFDPGSGGFLTTTGYGTMSLTGLPKVNTLYIRIVINNNLNEIWAVDNISLFGRRELFTEWNGSSWSNLAPTPSMKAVFSGNYDTQTYGNIQACKCEINAGASITIRENHHFVVQSELENLGTITIENGGSLVQKNDLATNTGAIRMRRYTTPMTRYDYTYWSSPVIGQTLFALSPLTQSDKYYAFNPLINNWENVASSSIMAVGKGYIVRAPQNFSLTTPAPYTGGMFIGVANNGFIQTPISGGAGAWNLIGNPYPSAISADSFIDLPANVPVINGTLYFWTHNTPITNNIYTDDDYAVYNKTGGTAAALNSGTGNNSVPTGNVASGQGFFVEALSDGQATFNNSMRITGNNMQFFRPAPKNEETESVSAPERTRLWTNLTHEQGGFKQALLGYIEGASDGDDRNYDGAVLDGGNVLSWYSILGGKKLSIQGKAWPFHIDDVVPMGFVTSVGGPLSVSVGDADGVLAETTVYLEDKFLGIIHNLSESPYVFTTDAGTFDTRFQLRFTTQALSNPDLNLASGVVVAVKDRVISVKSYQDAIKRVMVYDLLGRKLVDKTNVNADMISIPDAASAQQSLIVKIVLENDAVVTQTVLF